MQEINEAVLREFYETAPVYTERRFAKNACNTWTTRVNQIELHCDTCKNSRPFNNLGSVGAGPRGSNGFSSAPPTRGVDTVEFGCGSCRTSRRTYYIEWRLEADTVVFIKRGEYPRPKLDRDPILDKFFEEDQVLYEKAKICLANGYGIGAFAYLRQIVEKNIQMLLESIKAEAEIGEAPDKVMEALDQLRDESPMSEKITVANAALPAYLMPGGANPLGMLYGSLSAGIHQSTDEDCLERSNDILKCLKFLVGEMANRKKSRDNFASDVGKLK